MEDSVHEQERKEQEQETVQGKELSEEAGAGGDLQGGLLSTVASKIGAAMAGTNGSCSSGDNSKTKVSDGNAVASTSLQSEQEAGGEQAGLLSTMASKIGAAMSGTNGSCSSEEESKTKMNNGNGNVVASSSGEEEKDGGGGHRIIEKIKFNLPASSPVAEIEEESAEGKEQVVGSEQAGLLSTMASKIGLAMSGSNGSSSNMDDANKSNSEEEKGDEGSAGGTIKQQVSNPPASLPASDDRVPEADEASLLIAIIED